MNKFIKSSFIYFEILLLLAYLFLNSFFILDSFNTFHPFASHISYFSMWPLFNSPGHLIDSSIFAFIVGLITFILYYGFLFYVPRAGKKIYKGKYKIVHLSLGIMVLINLLFFFWGLFELMFFSP